MTDSEVDLVEKHLIKQLFYTHILFLMAACVLFFTGRYTLSILLLGTTLSSVVFHHHECTSDAPNLLMIDRFLAAVTFITCITIFFLSNKKHTPIILLIVVLCAVSFGYQVVCYNTYDSRILYLCVHQTWHVIIGMSCLFLSLMDFCKPKVVSQ
jgi:hypothetical protein